MYRNGGNVIDLFWSFSISSFDNIVSTKFHKIGGCDWRFSVDPWLFIHIICTAISSIISKLWWVKWEMKWMKLSMWIISIIYLLYKGLMVGLGVGITRDCSIIMIGQYFKRKREFVEIFAVSGSGLGIIIMSMFVRNAIGSYGWR